MTITTTKIHELVLSEKEYNAIEILEPVLAEMQNYFGEANTIQAVETGEIVEGEEIARMRAVLDFFYTHRAVRVI